MKSLIVCFVHTPDINDNWEILPGSVEVLKGKILKMERWMWPWKRMQVK